jgi:ABC-type transport system involved in multi-copper enzyme maturation permease subunit
MSFSAVERFPHRAFSPRRLAAIAGDTLTELTRLKAFYLLLFFALTLIGGSMVMARLSFQQEFQILKDISLGTISFFTSLLAIAASARMLPHEIENRTIYAVLAKPVPRFEYLAGKLLGVFLLLAISVIVMGALFFGVLYLREQSVLAETTRQMSGLPAEQVSEALRAIRAAALNSNLVPAIAMILVKAAVIASFTVFLSTFATSGIFTILMAVFVYFIGHLQATARANSGCRNKAGTG